DLRRRSGVVEVSPGNSAALLSRWLYAARPLMHLRLTPARRRGVEILDDPATPPDVRARSMGDVARSNALFGGTRAAIQALRQTLPLLPRGATLLDVGTGLADIPLRARAEARRSGVALTVIGIDVNEALLRSARERLDG